MDEYISKEEAIKELREVYEYEYPTASGDFDEYASHDVPNVLRNIPAADVQPVKHGRWILHTEQIVDVDIKLPTECSECGFEEFSAEKYNYCPNCGARMDSGSDE